MTQMHPANNLPPASEGNVLKLVVKKRGNGGFGTKPSCSFSKAGGTIGRGLDNTWVLVDPKNEISKRHARISFEGGNFCLTDESTNGTFINQSGKPVGRGMKVALRHGDILRLGTYEVAVHVRGDIVADLEEAGEGEWQGVAELFETERGEDALGVIHEGFPEAGNKVVRRGRNPGHETDPLVALHRSSLAKDGEGDDRHNVPEMPGMEFSSVQPYAEEDVTGMISSHMQVQSISPSPEKEMDAYLKELARAGAGRSEPMEGGISATGAGAGFSGAEVGQFARQGIESIEGVVTVLSPQNRNLWPLLEGLGFTDTPITDSDIPVFLREVGRALREALSGLTDIYAPNGNAGGQEIRVAASQLQPFEDNPIKASGTVGEVLKSLFGNRSPVHLGPEDAVRECLEGLRQHQSAVTAATLAGLQAVVASFEPSALRRRFAKYGEKSNDPAGLWAMFVQYSTQIDMKNPHGIKKLFDEVYQQSYDAHVKKSMNNN